MFLRVVRAAVSKGVKRDHVRVVEAYREGGAGKTQHRTVINLGRHDLLAAHLDLAFDVGQPLWSIQQPCSTRESSGC